MAGEEEMAERGLQRWPTTRPKSGKTCASYAQEELSEQHGPLGELAGTWEGTGFNLIARPDFDDKTDLYLQLGQTRENLKFEPIAGPIPNHGFGSEDVQLFGLTYLQEIADQGWDGGSRIEPGIWVTQAATSFPAGMIMPQSQIVGRMASIPHGNAILAEGCVTPYSGIPVKTVAAARYNGSLFPSFNTTPFGVPPTARGLVFNAAGTSEKIAGALAATPQRIPFPMYDLSVPAGPIAANQSFGGVVYNPQPPLPRVPSFTLNTRTPYRASGAGASLPARLNGVPMQAVVNDPILLLQKTNEDLARDGYSFEGFAFNIATVKTLRFLETANSPPPPIGAVLPPVILPQFGGGIENLPFLKGFTLPQTAPSLDQLHENAQTAVVYATFWVSKVTHENPAYNFVQLQYAQTVVLNFPILSLLNTPGSTYVNLGWPHVSVATLRKTSG